MTRPAVRAFLIWLLAMLAGAVVVWNSHFSADMSFFLPGRPSPAQQVLVDQLKEGVVTRLLMVAIAGGEAAQRATVSRQLRGRLEKRTLTPKVETLLLDKDILSIEREKQKLSINLANQPEALAFVDSIRGTLSGNRAALEKHYALYLSGDSNKWVLTLLPSEQKIAAMVQRITVTGSKNQVRVIEYLQADGDRSVLNIDPIDGK